MYTSWYTCKRHGTQDESNGQKIKKVQLFFGGGKPAPYGTTAFRGGGLKFLGSRATDENIVLAVNGGPTKGYLGCKGGVGNVQAQKAQSAPTPPSPPKPLL